ncbi:ribosomal RNA small subunit methyltransferase A [bacterium CG_4_10_14_0_2_um_filter_33_32]|nr:MAG: ribosomal RNA small subunit methyltransferase A [bacterium CG10_big_fil_rev_8_21_14_0_10_33_18]PIU76278.1 MAG: ribosomal RNA small subunit methyltransferase A [bacterium CG06_land_8_20_14_3_00_33_50]PIW81549.1 MAG: ribosomal RNA small subunit methyltransferase A [bacterium CG_4_8_14_3_um_filter_33_28]PIZ85627.1 MAG: ribosomal RNA small subunit methyltransferase A [bacterium CG_4_10_14_0_2_um_filter_33_32]PJA72001.1 MAG: ribosomal RNA small subunit methyltransferase A [bacterium CG_4_9_1
MTALSSFPVYCLLLTVYYGVVDLTNIPTIKNLLSNNKLWLSKKLGQHFLVSRHVLNEIINASNISKDDKVLEIGSGIGILTIELLKKADKVIAVEKDAALLNILKKTTKDFDNLIIQNKDILSFDIDKEIQGHYQVVSNIPYYITSPVIRKFLEVKNRPSSLIIMVQKEVAERIIAKPPNMNILAVSVQFFAKPEIISFVPKDSFWPKPKVDSAIIKITVNPSTLLRVGSKQTPEKRIAEKLFFRLIKIGFSSPRKKLVNNLAAGFLLNKEETAKLIIKSGVDSNKRPQDLFLEDWKRMYNVFRDNKLLK